MREPPFLKGADIDAGKGPAANVALAATGRSARQNLTVCRELCKFGPWRKIVDLLKQCDRFQ